MIDDVFAGESVGRSVGNADGTLGADGIDIEGLVGNLVELLGDIVGCIHIQIG